MPTARPALICVPCMSVSMYRVLLYMRQGLCCTFSKSSVCLWHAADGHGDCRARVRRLLAHAEEAAIVVVDNQHGRGARRLGIRCLRAEGQR